MWRFRVYRTLFFLLLAFDALSMSARPDNAPSTFRLSKVPLIFEDGLDWVPSDAVLWKVLFAASFTSLATALAPEKLYKYCAVVTALLYNFAYWANAVDRYQHHLLLAELLMLLPWAGEKSWVRRLIVVQVAIVYFWTAVAKVSDGGTFLSGDFVRTTSQRREVFDAVHLVAEALGISDRDVWSFAAYHVVAVELLLTALLLTGRAPLLAVFMGVNLHLGFEFVGRLSIGFFSWYMVLFYLLIIPPIRWPLTSSDAKTPHGRGEETDGHSKTERAREGSET
jgi:hypothetical protein